MEGGLRVTANRETETGKMKKFIIVLQILVLLSQSVRADTTGNAASSSEIALTQQQEVIPEMPKNYKLPTMQLLDSVAFYNEYKDQRGKRVSVQGISGRFGATFGEEFKRKVFDIERQAQEPVEIILTLSSTIEDAKILKDRMALSGRKMVIVEIPDHIQDYLLKKAEAEAAGGIKELWFDTKDKLGKLVNVGETLSNSKKIIQNQFVGPTRGDLRLVWVSVASTAVTTALLITVGGVDPTLALSLGVLRAMIGGTTLAYNKTLSNIFKSDIFNEFNITSTPRRALTRLSVMGLGIGQFYYLVGSTLAGSSYGLTQGQLITNTYTSGLVETLSSEERNNRLSERANHNMIIGHIIIGAAISSAAIVGKTGPLLYSAGFFQVSSLLAGTVVLYTGFFFAYKYFSHHVEKVAQHDLFELGRVKWQRIMNMKRARAERFAQEQQAISSRRARLNEILEETRLRTAMRNAPACARLFY